MISAVILTKNEEANISDCVKSLSWCDEVVVVDDNSKDRTIELVKKLNARVYTHPINNDFSSQRNFGLSKAKGDWVLFVDADERVSSSLAFEISNAIIFSSEFNGFYIKRRDVMWKKELKYGESGNMHLLRLGKKGVGKWEGKVHEEWEVKGNIGKLKNPIMHFPHKTFQEFLKEINFYTTVRAEELYKKGAKANFLSILLYPLGKFLFNFLLKLGFIDGMPGLIVALAMSFHSFLVRGKLWLLWQKKE